LRRTTASAGRGAAAQGLTGARDEFGFPDFPDARASEVATLLREIAPRLDGECVKAGSSPPGAVAGKPGERPAWTGSTRRPLRRRRAGSGTGLHATVAKASAPAGPPRGDDRLTWRSTHDVLESSPLDSYDSSSPARATEPATSRTSIDKDMCSNAHPAVAMSVHIQTGWASLSRVATQS